VNPVLALAIVLVAGLAVTRLPRLPHPSALRLDLVASAGLPLVVLGILLGPALGVLDADVLRALAPATALGIAWIGATFGASLSWRYVRRIPRALWLLAGAEAVAVLVATGVVGWLLIRMVHPLGAAFRPTLPTVFTLAAIAVVTGPSAVAMTARAAGIRRSVRQAFEIAAWLDTAAGALAFTLILTLYHPREPAGGGLPLGWLSWLGLALVSGLLFGVLYLGLTHFAKDSEERDLGLLGVLLFGAGVGYAADLSPFVICAVAAAVIVNRSPHRRAALALLRAWEHPVSAILLILSGAVLSYPTAWVLVAAAVLVAARAASRWAAVRYGRRPLHLDMLPPDLGLAGVAQGTVAVALAMNFFILYGPAAGGPVVTTALVGLGLNLLLAPAAMTRALRPPPLTTSPASPEVT